MSDDTDLPWLVKSRSRVQFSLLKLHKSAPGDETSNSEIAGLFQVLVGAGYSMWRAVFLADPARDKTATDRAAAFLNTLIQDNAIGYYQEFRERSWTSGYYMNSALFRLQLAYRKLDKVTTLSRRVDAYLENQARPGLGHSDQPLRPEWELAADSLDQLIAILAGERPRRVRKRRKR